MRGPLLSDAESSRNRKLLVLKQAIWASRFDPGMKALQALLEDAEATQTYQALQEKDPGLKERNSGRALQCGELLQLFYKEPSKLDD